MTSAMNGAQALLATMESNGIEVCFANPGTSEMHFVAALDESASIRGVLGLFEGVVTGAADGYSRMTDRPAATLLHLGPGMANGLSNLHNALRSRAGIVNVIGDHATYHRALDAPLTSDIEGAARPFSHWVRTSPSAGTIAADTADAIGIGQSGRIASLILPADTAWSPAPAFDSAPQATRLPVPPIAEADVAAAAEALRSHGARAAVLLGGRAARAEQLALAAAVCEATGAQLLTETHTPRTERGAGRPITARIPYAVDQAQEFLADIDVIVLIDARDPVAFFAYPDKASRLTRPGTTFITVAAKESDTRAGLEALADAVGATGASGTAAGTHAGAAGRYGPAGYREPTAPTGPITPESLAAALACLIPEHGIVVDESITTGWKFGPATAHARPHDWLSGTGGSIGYAMPTATGAALACPDRQVLTLESDGSGMYMPTALWTQAREGLDVVTLIFANRRYQILRNEMRNVGVPDFGPKAGSLLDIDRPDIDWVRISEGMGVPASRAETCEELITAVEAAYAAGGPHLVEVVL